MKQLVLPAGALSGLGVELRGKEYHYLARVRRVVAGERLAALEGERKLVLEVVEVLADHIRLRLIEDKHVSTHLGPRIVLFPFLLKARKLDDVIRQACEAGVSTIVPVSGDHCIAKTDEEDGVKKAARWNTIAKEAAQQSGNARVCDVQAPIASRDITGWWSRWGAGPLLFFHQEPLDKGSLHRYLFTRSESVGLIVGPEGGLSPSELKAFQMAGAGAVWLGPFVLRAETASLYAVAAVNTILQETTEWTIPL
jgi:16S rRNA (uracil1498-N3)-methyltransferase